MGNVRVFSLARDLNLSSQEVIDRLKKLGVEAKTASSSVDEDTADKLRRILKIDALTAKKRRVYGSDEDEDERDRLEREQREKVAAERAAREKAAEEARQAAEDRKSGRGRKKEPEKPADDATPAALAHAPGAPRLAPKVAAPPPTSLEDEAEGEAPAAETEEYGATDEAAVEAAGETAPEAVPEEAPEDVPQAAAPAAPPVPAGPVRTTVTAPRVAVPLRPIAPPPPPAPPVATRAAGPGGRPLPPPPRRAGRGRRPAGLSGRTSAGRGPPGAAPSAAPHRPSPAGRPAPDEPAPDESPRDRRERLAPLAARGLGPSGHAGPAARPPRGARALPPSGPPGPALEVQGPGGRAARGEARLQRTAPEDERQRGRHRQGAVGEDARREVAGHHEGAHHPRDHGDGEPEPGAGARDRDREGVRLRGLHPVVRGGARPGPDVRVEGGGPRPAGARGHGHGPRRPRQDLAPRLDPPDRGGGGRGRRDHPAHRRLPRRRRAAPGRVPRHPGPRGVHRSCGPAAPRSRTSSCWWSPPTTASCPRPSRPWTTRRRPACRSWWRSTRSTSPRPSPTACASSSPTGASCPRSGAAPPSSSTCRRRRSRGSSSSWRCSCWWPTCRR